MEQARMKIEIVYYELCKKQFRSKNSLNKFLKSKFDMEILTVCEYKKGVCYRLEKGKFLNDFKYKVQRA